MTNEELNHKFALLADAQAKTDAQLAKTDAQLAKTDAKLDRIAKMMGGIAGNQGDVAEEYFYNSLLETKQIGGISFDEIYEKLKGGKASKQLEYDIVLVNGNAAAIVEVKYKAHVSALSQIHEQLAHFKTHFPEYQHMKLYGGIAAFSVPDDLTQAAQEQGFFVLKRKGDVLEVDSAGMRAF